MSKRSEPMTDASEVDYKASFESLVDKIETIYKDMVERFKVGQGIASDSEIFFTDRELESNHDIVRHFYKIHHYYIKIGHMNFFEAFKSMTSFVDKFAQGQALTMSDFGERYSCEVRKKLVMLNDFSRCAEKVALEIEKKFQYTDAPVYIKRMQDYIMQSRSIDFVDVKILQMNLIRMAKSIENSVKHAVFPPFLYNIDAIGPSGAEASAASSNIFSSGGGASGGDLLYGVSPQRSSLAFSPPQSRVRFSSTLRFNTTPSFASEMPSAETAAPAASSAPAAASESPAATAAPSTADYLAAVARASEPSLYRTAAVSEPPQIFRQSFPQPTSGGASAEVSSDEDYDRDERAEQRPALPSDIARQSRDMLMKRDAAFDMCVTALQGRNNAFEESENLAKIARKLMRTCANDSDFDMDKLNRAMADWHESISKLRYATETYNFVRNQHVDLLNKYDEFLDGLPETIRVLLR